DSIPRLACRSGADDVADAAARTDGAWRFAVRRGVGVRGESAPHLAGSATRRRSHGRRGSGCGARVRPGAGGLRWSGALEERAPAWSVEAIPGRAGGGDARRARGVSERCLVAAPMVRVLG